MAKHIAGHHVDINIEKSKTLIVFSQVQDYSR